MAFEKKHKSKNFTAAVYNIIPINKQFAKLRGSKLSYNHYNSEEELLLYESHAHIIAPLMSNISTVHSYKIIY